MQERTKARVENSSGKAGKMADSLHHDITQPRDTEENQRILSSLLYSCLPITATRDSYAPHIDLWYGFSDTISRVPAGGTMCGSSRSCNNGVFRFCMVST